MFVNASREDSHEEEPVLSDVDNFGHTGLGVFIADNNRVARLHGQSGSKVAQIRIGEPVVVTSLEVDPQIPSHGGNLRPGAMCEPTSARRRASNRKATAVVFERPRKHPHEDNAALVDRDHLGNSRIGLFVPNRDQVTQGDRHAVGEVLHAGVRQSVTIAAG